MSNEHTLLNLGEIPHTAFFARRTDGIWEHLTRDGDEPGEGSENYVWSEGNYLDAANYEKMLPREPLLRNNLKESPDIPLMHVPLKILDGSNKEKDANSVRILDRLSVFVHLWYYLLQTDKHNAAWAKLRLEALQSAGNNIQLKLPLSFTSLIDHAQRIASEHTPYERTADLNAHLRENGAKLEQPRLKTSELKEWEQPLFSKINTLSTAYNYALLAGRRNKEMGRKVRARIEAFQRGRRKTAPQFSSQTCSETLFGPDEKCPLSLKEKIIVADATSVNPADFIPEDEFLRFHFELIILASHVKNDKPVRIITEAAVRLLMTWEQNEAVFKKLDDTLFKKDIWTMLMKGSAPDQFKSGHIWQIASRLGVQNIMKYLTGEDFKTSNNIQVM